MLVQLAVVLLMLRSLRAWNSAEAVLALLLMLLSAASLEVFYLTPVIMALVLLYYRLAMSWPAQPVSKAAACFLLPQAIIVVLHLLASMLSFGTLTARLGDAPLHQSIRSMAVKPPMLLFHLAGGRFLPQAIQDAVYAGFCTYLGAGVFYAALCGMTAFVVLKFRRRNRNVMPGSIAFWWMLAALAMASLLWLPTRLLILGDRYLYFVLPPFCLLVAMLLLRIRANGLRLLLAGVIIGLQCVATLRLSWLWQRSDMLNRAISASFSVPPDSGRVILLLNNPHALCGAPMIGAGEGGELMLMRKLFRGDTSSRKIYEVAATDIGSEGAVTSFRWINDSTVEVQSGFYWWRSSDYLHPYRTPDYAIRVDSANGHAYILQLRGGRRRFVLMYTVGGRWRVLSR